MISVERCQTSFWEVCPYIEDTIRTISTKITFFWRPTPLAPFGFLLQGAASKERWSRTIKPQYSGCSVAKWKLLKTSTIKNQHKIICSFAEPFGKNHYKKLNSLAIHDQIKCRAHCAHKRNIQYARYAGLRFQSPPFVFFCFLLLRFATCPCTISKEKSQNTKLFTNLLSLRCNARSNW